MEPIVPLAGKNRCDGRFLRPTVEAVTTCSLDHPCRPAGPTTPPWTCWSSARAPAWPRHWRPHERGLSVLIVEKSAYVGGSTARSGGALWLPASPILEENQGRRHAATCARTYLDSVVGGTAPPQRSAEFLAHLSETVEMLRRTTPMRFIWARDYSDYHPEAAWRGSFGRTCECKPFNTSVLGRVPVAVASRRDEGVDSDADHRRGLPLDELDGAGASQGAPAVREAAGPGRWRPAARTGTMSLAGRRLPRVCSPAVLRAGIPIWTRYGVVAVDHRRQQGHRRGRRTRRTRDHGHARGAGSCWLRAASTTAWTCGGSFSPSRSAST